MKIKNLNNTTDNDCKCNSWLDHWLKFSDKSSLPKSCGIGGCSAKPDVGAHVKKVDSVDNKWYILPVCYSHNARKNEEFEKKNDVELVIADVTKTCGI